MKKKLFFVTTFLLVGFVATVGEHLGKRFVWISFFLLFFAFLFDNWIAVKARLKGIKEMFKIEVLPTLPDGFLGY
jgi:hypothetical protein